MFDGLPYKVVDDFLPEIYHWQLKETLCGPNHPWCFLNNIDKQENTLGGFGFEACVVNSSDPQQIAKGPRSSSISEMIMPFCFSVQQLVGAESILKVRCDMTLYNPLGHMHHPHIDHNGPHIASVYYVNDSDGNTVLFNHRATVNDPKTFPSLDEMEVLVEVEPRANRLLVFDGNLIHTGHSPSKNNYRVIINSDYC